MPTTTNIPKPVENGTNQTDEQIAAIEKHVAEIRRRNAYDQRLGTPDGQTPEPDRNGVLGEGM